jgi:hypothetical protein
MTVRQLKRMFRQVHSARSYMAGREDANMRNPRQRYDGINYRDYKKGYRHMVKQMRKDGWA